MQGLNNIASLITDLPNLSRDKTFGPANAWKCEFTSHFVGNPIYKELKSY